MKSLLITLTALCAIAFSSCNSVSTEMPKTWGGQIIYSNVNLQHTFSSEPTNIAFRLLIWIKDGKKTTDSNFEKLFGLENQSATITETADGSGIYIIDYPSNYNNSYDVLRKSGQIQIDTQNNLLENSGDEWSVSLVEDKPLKLLVRNQTVATDTEYTFSYCNSTIACTSENNWSIQANTNIDWPKVDSQTPVLSWEVNNTISFAPGDGTTTLDKFIKGAVNVDRLSYETGSFSILNQDFTWEVTSELTYKMSCAQQTTSLPFPSKGSLIATFESLTPIDPTIYPSKTVEVSFTPIEGRCSSKGLLTYNGFQLNF